MQGPMPTALQEQVSSRWNNLSWISGISPLQEGLADTQAASHPKARCPARTTGPRRGEAFVGGRTKSGSSHARHRDLHLRLADSKALNLKGTDIDSERMVPIVRAGPGCVPRPDAMCMLAENIGEGCPDRTEKVGFL